jgi:hypothetical protein
VDLNEKRGVNNIQKNRICRLRHLRAHRFLELFQGDAMDSLHIACAERARAVLLTTDDGLITFFKLHQNIQVHRENPVTWLKERNK